MPFFFILPVWLLTVLVALVMLLARGSRTAGIYVLLASTGGLVCSFLLSTAVLLLSGFALGGTRLAWLALVFYVVGILIGGLLGVIGGLWAARKFTMPRSLSSGSA